MTAGPWTGWTGEPTIEAEPDRTLEAALTRADDLQARLTEIRAAVVEAGSNGLRWNDLRARLAPRLLAIIDAPLGEPAPAFYGTGTAG